MKKNKLIFYCLPFLLVSTFFFSNNASAIFDQFSTTLLARQTKIPLRTKALNSIYFYEECIPGSGGISSGACGDTAREIYWSVLRQHFEVIQVAGIFGNIDNEGGFSPTKWQYNLVSSPGAPLQRSFDELYNWPPCSGGGCVGGVGSFQITSALGPYLQYVDEKAPELLEYFKDTKYSANGDEVLKIMPKNDFIRLVEIEVSYVMDVHLNKSKLDSFKSITEPGDAARWWSSNYEMCGPCMDWNSSENNERAVAAQQEYETMKSFTCSSSSSSQSSSSTTNSNNSSNTTSSTTNNTVSGDQITWIGDSYSVAANNKGLLPSGVDIGPGTIDTSSSYIQVSKFVSSSSSSNPSCLSILEDIINANKLRPTLVFACGTNGGWSDSDIAKFKNLLQATDSQAIVVNSKTPNNDYSKSNDKLKQMADSNDNITLADWVSVYKEDYFESDGSKIHPYTDPGFQEWVGAINNALYDSGESCTTYEGDYPEYLQCSGPWKDTQYGSSPDQTMCTSACGAVSMAMLATVAANQDIFPEDVANLLGSSYYFNTSGSGMYALDKIIGDHYGFEVVNVPFSSIEDAENKMTQYLDDGYMIHLSGMGDSYPFSLVGHYIGIFGWTGSGGDNVMLANSGGGGNKEASLHDVLYAGLHGDSFSAVKGTKNTQCNPNSASICPESTNNTSTNNNKVTKAVQEIIELANKNGSTYTWGGGHTSDESVFKAMLNGSPIDVDCTGFASLVIYKAFGKMASFSSESIFSDPSYEEVSRSDVRPGDIFAYNSPSGHGGIVIETQNGKITKIAETGGVEGRSGNNSNIGYSGSDDFSVTNSNSDNGHFFRLKGV